MRKIVLLVLITVSFQSYAQDISSFFNKADVFFKDYVNNGSVAYSRIHDNPEALNELLDQAEKVSVSDSDAKTYQAFWINTYNLSVIKGIIDNYPMKSPLDKAGFFDKIEYRIAGKFVTLNTIENKLLRAKFNDARFHFVLVCGAVGCPPLINKGYLPSTLETQLDTQTKIALNGNFLKVNAKKKRVEGSEILKWYKEDFVQNGNEIDFINNYRTEKIPSNFKLSYFPYNWQLNGE
jgi:hypothetical protein